jgi:hypothetical protein
MGMLPRKEEDRPRASNEPGYVRFSTILIPNLPL